jgi:predicted aspartyl protease
MMPVIKARFRAPNRQIREGNVLIDSGAGTTVTRKQFAKKLGLNGKRERINLAVVGGETIEQPHSRQVTFWISAVDGGEEFKIEAHEIEKTIFSVPDLNRKLLGTFSHLQDIEFRQAPGSVDLILGVHYTHLHAEEEI